MNISILGISCFLFCCIICLTQPAHSNCISIEMMIWDVHEFRLEVNGNKTCADTLVFSPLEPLPLVFCYLNNIWQNVGTGSISHGWSRYYMCITLNTIWMKYIESSVMKKLVWHILVQVLMHPFQDSNLLNFDFLTMIDKQSVHHLQLAISMYKMHWASGLLRRKFIVYSTGVIKITKIEYQSPRKVGFGGEESFLKSITTQLQIWVTA